GARLDKHSMVSRAILSPRLNLRFAPSKDFTLRASFLKILNIFLKKVRELFVVCSVSFPRLLGVFYFIGLLKQ
ncbi:MAG: hypothetical protein ACFNQD_06190, partial [Prevotella intermedia]